MKLRWLFIINHHLGHQFNTALIAAVTPHFITLHLPSSNNKFPYIIYSAPHIQSIFSTLSIYTSSWYVILKLFFLSFSKISFTFHIQLLTSVLSSVKVCDMIILDHEKPKCLYDLLNREIGWYRATVHILSVAVLWILQASKVVFLAKSEISLLARLRLP